MLGLPPSIKQPQTQPVFLAFFFLLERIMKSSVAILGFCVLLFVYSFDEYYPVPGWDDIPSELPSEEEMEKEEKSSEFGDCICDLTSNQCDFNCLCDPDCSEEEIGLFSGTLLPETGFVSKQRKCGALKSVISNLPSGVTYDYKPATGGICVVYETNPSLGYYYDYVPDIVNVGDFDLAKNEFYLSLAPKEDPNSVFEHESKTNTDTVTRKYHVGDRMEIRRTTSLTETVSNWFTIPRAVNGAECVEDAIFPKFMVPIHSSKCSYNIGSAGNLSSLAATSLNPTYYVQDVRVSRESVPSATTTSVFIAVSTQSVDNVATTIDPTEPICVSSGSGYSCTGIITSIIYTVMYSDTTMKITGVTADIILSDLDTTMGYVDFESAVFFAKTGESTKVFSGEIRAKSGNPGYLPQTSVLAGRLYETGGSKAIEQRTSGLEVPSTGQACDALSLEFSQVMFMEDTTSACSLEFLDEAALIVGCTNANLEPYSNLNFPLSVQYLGRFGNANLNNFNEWVEIISQTAFETVVYENRLCKNVPAIVNLVIVLARTGPLRNMQWKIVGARKEIETEEWTVRGGQSQFYIKYRVSFVEDVGQLNYPTMAPIKSLISIPRGWLYPLNVLFGGSQRNFVSAAVMLLSFCLLL